MAEDVMQSSFLLLSGGLDVNLLPSFPQTQIKIYVSSNTQDMQTEETVLSEHIYPQLRKKCRQKTGLECHVVDSRWGTTTWEKNSLYDWPMYNWIIDDCRRSTNGLNFIAFIGQRYGEAILPSFIPCSDFHLIRSSLAKHRSRETKDSHLLDLFYIKDDNMLHPVYILNPNQMNKITSSTKISSLMQGEEMTWQKIQCLLEQLILKGIDLFTTTHDEITLSLISDFEREIEYGLNHFSPPSLNSLVFIRTIVDLRNYISLPVSHKFGEISCAVGPEERPRLDEKCQKKLSHMKEKVIKCLPADHVVSSSILWKYEDGINRKLHSEYLDNICLTFETKVEEMWTDKEQPLFNDDLLFEISQHWMIAHDVTRGFMGMEDVLDLIKTYVLSNEDRPLVVFGETGSGKSSVIAKAAMQVKDWILSDCNHVITVVRFIATTSSSFDIRQILFSICRQVTMAANPSEDVSSSSVPINYLDLLEYFFQTLDCFPDDRNLVIFLDGIHLMETQYEAHILQWIPQHLKDNVKVILTVSPGDMLELMRKELIQRVNNFIEIPLFLPDQCRTLMTSCLEEKKRKLTEEQEKAISDHCFTFCASPLYVKLVANVVSRWTSTQEVDLTVFPDTVEKFIQGFLEDMEIRYGNDLTNRALTLLTLSIKGLSDCEMDDLLSMDDVALRGEGDEAEHRVPKRIPPMAWQRIKFHLQDFIKPIICERVTVCQWCQNAFAEAVHLRYVMEDKVKQERHSLIADYWLGNRRTGGRTSEKLIDLDERLIPEQPLILRLPDFDHSKPLYNLRKLDQLPVQLSLAGRNEDLNKSVLFNFHWMYYKVKSFSLECVLSDYRFGKGPEVKLVESALRSGSFFITENPESMAPEVTGRLLGYYDSQSNIQELINECDRLGVEHCSFVPNFPYRQMSGGALKYVVDCDDFPLECVIVGEEEDILLTKDSSSPLIHVIDLVTGEEQGAVPTSIGNMYISKTGRHVAIVDYAQEKSIKIHNLETGKFLGHLIPLNYIGLGSKHKQEISCLCLDDTHLCLTITAETNWLCIADINKCMMASILNLPKRSTVCEIMPNSKHVFINTGSTLLSYDLESMELINNTILEEIPNQLIISENSQMGFIVGKERNQLLKITIHDGKIEFQVKIDLKSSLQNDCIQSLQLSNSQELLLIRGYSNLVIYNLIDDRILCHLQRPLEVPPEFRLPKSFYSELSFSQARFSGDNKYLIASIFRDIIIWQIGSGSNCRLITKLQTPVGLIRDFYITSCRGLIVTAAHSSKKLHIWSLQDSIGHVDILDRMTSPINDIIITADDSRAFVKCIDSDEIGIIDMRTGNLVDLLTHESPVIDICLSSSGDYAIISLKNAKPGQFNKIWKTLERKILYEFGNVESVNIFCHQHQSFISLLQEKRTIKEPFHLSIFKKTTDRTSEDEEEFEEMKTDIEIPFILEKPFLSADDHYLVIMSAEDYDYSRVHYVNPCICAVSLKTPILTLATYTPRGLKERVSCLRRILNIRPCPTNPFTIIVLYTNEPDIVNGRTTYEHNYGFLILDLCSSIICQLIEDFLLPFTPLNGILFTRDIRLCIDHQSNVYDMSNGFCLVNHLPGQVRPRSLAMKDNVVLYSDGEYLLAVRIADGKCLGRLSVHAQITYVVMCHDGRTVVLGCSDGSVVSHVLVDVDIDDRMEIIGQIATRKSKYFSSGGPARIWDKVNTGASAPVYSRSPSTVAGSGPTDTQLLQNHMKPFSIIRSNRPPSSSQLYNISYGSQTCLIM